MPDKLYDYQRKGVEFIKARRRVILADEMGLGKTVQAITAIEESEMKPALIVVGLKIAIGVWQTEIRKWTGENSLVYTGKPKEREKLWKNWNPELQPYVIVNFMLLKEILQKKNKWKSVVFDEYHLMGLRKRRSKTFNVAKDIFTGMLILCSGSPMSQGPQDLWGPLHLIDKRKFGSYWKFVTYYCEIEESRWGKTVGRYPSRPNELKLLLQRFMVRRLKKHVLDALPSKTRQVIPIELDPPQTLMYNRLAKEMMLELPDGDILVTPSVIAKLLALRQLLVSPRLIGIDYEGVALAALKMLIYEEFTAKNSVAVFTPFRKGVEEIAKALQYVTPHIYIIMGGMKPEEAAAAIAGYQNNPNKKKILIATIKSAVSFTASEGNVAFFLGQEWDHNDNIQAEDRLHRVGQKNPVRVYYFKHLNTIEEHVLDVVMDKYNAAGFLLNKQHLLPHLKDDKVGEL